MMNVVHEKTELINTKSGQENVIKLFLKNEIVYYSINGNVVHQHKFLGFDGSNFKIIVFNDEETDNESMLIQSYTFKDTETYESILKNAEMENLNVTGTGSGFFVHSDGYIITNNHVINDFDKILVKYKQNGVFQKFKAEVVKIDKVNDLALLKIIDSAFISPKSIPYEISLETKAMGTEVFCLGYPLSDVIGETIKFSDGKISSISGYDDNITEYQISIPIQEGNSGSPVFDNNGNIVAVVTGQLNKAMYKSENVNYAIKSLILKNIVDVIPNPDLKKTTKVKKMSQIEKVKLFSDYMVLIETY